MSRVLVAVAILVLGVAGIAAVPNEAPKKPGILGALQKDQKVSLKESAGGYQINVMPGVPLGHKVVEVGPDYVVLEDIAGVTETRIPIYAIKAVTVTRIEKAK